MFVSVLELGGEWLVGGVVFGEEEERVGVVDVGGVVSDG